MAKSLVAAVILFGAAALHSGPAGALSFGTVTSGTGTVIRADGEFAVGDMDKLRAQFQRAQATSKPVHTVAFNSGGGNVKEALEIGRYLRDQNVSTRVDAGKECASACVYAFLGGLVREASDSAKFGVHMHSLYGSQQYVDKLKGLLRRSDFDMDTKVRLIIILNEQFSAEASGRLAAYVLSMGVSIRMLEPTFATSAVSMRYLTPAELHDFNILNAR